MAIEKEDQTTYEAMKKSDFDDCKKLFKADKKKRGEQRKVLNDTLALAAAEKKLHRAAFSRAMSILEMPEPKRGEYLFHLGHYLKWGGALDQPDLLPDDRDDDTKDLRPRHLRQADAEKEVGEAADKTKTGEDGKPLN